jgi:hypothetical protein
MTQYFSLPLLLLLFTRYMQATLQSPRVPDTSSLFSYCQKPFVWFLFVDPQHPLAKLTGREITLCDNPVDMLLREFAQPLAP